MLAVAMEESGKAELINTSEPNGRTHRSYLGAAGDVSSVVRPEIDAELEREMRQALEGILEEEGV